MLWKSVLSIDVEDWFHILDSDGTPPIEQWDGLESRIEANLEKMLAGPYISRSLP